jgi:hypothetical protein
MSFRLEEVTVEALKDSKGRYIPSVMAVAMSDEELAEHRSKARDDENKILLALDAHKGKAASLTELAAQQGWKTRAGITNKSRARFAVDRLIRAKLLKRERDQDDLVLTEAGLRAVSKLK